MNRIGAEGAHGAPTGEGVEKVHAGLKDDADASPEALHGTAEAQAEPVARAGGLHVPLVLVVLTLGLVAATGASVVVSGIALGLGPAALIAATLDGALAARWPAIAAVMLGPFLTIWLLHRSWSAFARARTGRCAEYMLAALLVSIGLHALLFGPPSL